MFDNFYEGYIALIAVVAVICFVGSFFTKLFNEPKVLAKFIFVLLFPIFLAGSISYFLIFSLFQFPWWLNAPITYAIYAICDGYLSDRIDVRFKDERK